ncbi:MAG: tetratricopeptide repeat protein [bacterium]|nr:tetratricopeptide repeat protein [bacterium]
MANGPDQTRLNDLKQRWRQDPSSRLFLQLADEHRKHGQLPEAIAILEQGLENRPNDLSALVALGRCRLELDQAVEAIEPLEIVVTRDPTHIVANKLLVEAHLQDGDAEKANERLETYKLLNDRDPELDHLEYRLEKLRSETEEQEASTVVGDEPFELEEDLPAEEASVVEEDIAQEPVEEPEAEEAVAEEAAPEPDLAAAPEPFAEVVEPSPTEAPSPAGGGDPFQLAAEPSSPDLDSLWSRPSAQASAKPEEPFAGLIGLDSGRHWELLAGEGIFASLASEAPAAEPPVAEEIPAVEQPAEPAVAEEIPEIEAAAEPAFEEPVFEEPVFEKPAFEEPAFEEPAFEEPAEEAAAEAVPEPDAADAVAEDAPAPEPVEAAEEPEPIEAAEEPEPETSAATATLGELYLKQGHREEAERIFHRVLEQDPGNAAALAGLEKLGGASPRQLTAADLLAVRSASGKVPEGLTAKKVLVLGNYIQHLRASTRDHVH